MSNNVFFKGLSELRAIAALAVLFHHIELYKHTDHLPSLYDTSLSAFIQHLGKNGVYLFFVLSGFLITYLLLVEKSRNGIINIPKFYLRRVLRIWPVYYLVLLLSFFLIPLLAKNITALAGEPYFYKLILRLQDDFLTPFILFLLFLPNLALQVRPAIVGASQSWSVGVEEQFYILWPNVINKIKQKYLPYFFFAIIISLTVFKHISAGNDYKYIKLLKDFLGSFVIELMAIGALAAYLLFYHKDIIKKVFTSQILFLANLLIIAGLLLKPTHLLFIGFFFTTLILFIIQEDNRIKLNLRSKVLDKVGVLSYGIYMYHPIVMYFCFAFVNSLNLSKGSTFYNISIYFLIVAITSGISYWSYYYFESIFLRLKDKKFTIIKSGKSQSESNSQLAIYGDTLESILPTNSLKD